jgi:flagellar basal body-associated protein FliL
MKPRSAQTIGAIALVVAALALTELTGVTHLLAELKSWPLVLKGGLGRRGSAAPEEASGEVPSVKQEFLIPLSDSGSERYLRAVIVIELDHRHDQEELQRHLPALREAFIARSVDDNFGGLSGADGMKHSRENMRVALRKTQPKVGVRGVYFSDFILR